LSKEEVIVLHHYLGEGLSKAAIARKLGGEPPQRAALCGAGRRGAALRPSSTPAVHDPYKTFLKGRLAAYPELSAGSDS